MRGRPKKPPGDTRKTFFQIRVTDEEREIIKQAAEAKSLDASAWARSELLSLARKILASERRRGE
jgi:uncharacterized protein (DUF1778 family)